ncbi:MAG: tail fiber domain-containing protein [Endomicrobiales bacterium]|nr:tail fiber domain-containing protein [Endomicrobiales bacterium]
MYTKIVRVVAVMFLLLMVSRVYAGEKKINLQGKLTDSLGDPVTGYHVLKFMLYDKSSSEALWGQTENHGVTIGDDGLFNVTLGADTANLDGLDFNAEYEVGIAIDSENEMTPKQAIGASGYALGSVSDFNVKKDLTVLENVAIGTTTASAKLHVYGNNPSLYVQDDDEVIGFMQAVGPSDNLLQIGTLGNQGLDFYLNSASRMRIQPNGKVGIGTDNPSAELHVYSANSPTIRLEDDNEAVGFMQAAGYPDNIVQMGTLGEYPLDIYVNGGTRMWFATSGDIGVNKTNPGIHFDVQGYIQCIQCYEDSDIRLKEQVENLSGDIKSRVMQLSAIKYKFNKNKLKDIEYSARVEKLKELNLEKDVKAEKEAKILAEVEKRDLSFCDREQVGLNAQELEEQFPELVYTDRDGYKSIAYSKLSVILLEVIKGQQTKIEDLEQRLIVLENK